MVLVGVRVVYVVRRIELFVLFVCLRSGEGSGTIAKTTELLLVVHRGKPY